MIASFEIGPYLAQGEGLQVEFKEAVHSVPVSLYETVISFSNTDGGVIVLGVTDEGNVNGVETIKIPQYLKDITSTLNDRQSIDPPLTLSPFKYSYENKWLIIVQVPASSQVHKFKGNIFIRDADADLCINDHQRVSELYHRKQELFTEGMIYKALTMDDLDPSLFVKARNTIRSSNSSHSWLSMTDEELLKSSLLYKKDFRSGEQGLTLAAALIFGKDDTIHSLLPAYKVEAMVRRVNQDRWDDRITLRTNLIDTYLSLMEFIRKHLQEKFYTEEYQRKDLRDLIFREVVGNLIVHREYTNHSSSELIITNDIVYTTNPNKAKFYGPIDLNDFNPYPKNPNIRKFFTAFGWTDEIGSGVRNTRKYVSNYVPGARPRFIEGDIFRAEIPMVAISMGMLARDICNWLQLTDTAFSHISSGLTNIVLPIHLKDKPFQEIIQYLVSCWEQNGLKLAPLDWPARKQGPFDERQLAIAFEEDGVKLLQKKTLYFIRILFYGVLPISLEQMMLWMDYQNRKTFRDNYLLPLQEVGFIRMTIPAKPRDPNQKYVITEKGRMFLSGTGS